MNSKQHNLISSTIVKILVVVYIVILVLGIVKFFRNYRLTDCVFELIFVIALPILGVLYIHQDNYVSFPMSIAGKAVHPDSTKKALTGRIMAYIFDSLQYSIVISVLISATDLWKTYKSGGLAHFGITDWLDSAGALLTQFVAFFALFFAMDYVMYEFKAKRYLKQQHRAEQRKKAYKNMLEDKDSHE